MDSEQVIEVSARAAAQIAAAAQRMQAAERELNATVQIVADALDVPPGYQIQNTASGLVFVPPAQFVPVEEAAAP